MQEELKQDIQDLKGSVELLSSEINQQFIRLNENFSNSVNKLSNQIAHLSEMQVLSNKHTDSIIVKSNEGFLEKTQIQSNIPDDYLIDYSYIKDQSYLSWVVNLNKYSKSMAECRHQDSNKDQIPNFCQSARKTIESAIIFLFEQEYKYISENNTTFLDAYQRVKKFYNKPGKSDYLADIYIYNQGTITAKHIKKIGENYIDLKKIEEIYKKSLPAAVRIVFELIRQDFYDASGFPHLRQNYLTIVRMNELRNIQCHGSKDPIDVQLNKISKPAQDLFYSKTNFSIIKNSISWFVEEVYNRQSKISDNTNN
ncbi:hypothetical protein H1Q63_07055 [Desmonostoc muscorum CCALA 125]|nr:hypothetical protein [Desmonostoc muscorum CCALA 125]